jgi:hypothetical protein
MRQAARRDVTLLPSRRCVDRFESHSSTRHAGRLSFWIARERMIGTLRRDCLDHVIILSENHLRRIVRGYLGYYHSCRTHLSLEKDTPAPRKVESPDQGKVVEIPMVGGLHHRYARLAACSFPGYCDSLKPSAQYVCSAPSRVVGRASSDNSEQEAGSMAAVLRRSCPSAREDWPSTVAGSPGSSKWKGHRILETYRPAD